MEELLKELDGWIEINQIFVDENELKQCKLLKSILTKETAKEKVLGLLQLLRDRDNLHEEINRLNRQINYKNGND